MLEQGIAKRDTERESAVIGASGGGCQSAASAVRRSFGQPFVLERARQSDDNQSTVAAPQRRRRDAKSPISRVAPPLLTQSINFPREMSEGTLDAMPVRVVLLLDDALILVFGGLPAVGGRGENVK